MIFVLVPPFDMTSVYLLSMVKYLVTQLREYFR